MKKQIEKIIEQLADKSLTPGCKFKMQGGSVETLCSCGLTHVEEVRRNNKRLGVQKGELYFEWGDGHVSSERIVQVLGHPVRIGDVLDALIGCKKYLEHRFEDDHRKGVYHVKAIPAKAKLYLLWEPCGFTKSLQEIFGPGCEYITTLHEDGVHTVQVPMYQKKRALAELLVKLIDPGMNGFTGGDMN